MWPSLPDDPSQWMQAALAGFKECPRCRADDYVVFDGCSKCGYVNRFAKHAITAVPGSMASFAAWDTMFMLESMAPEIDEDNDKATDVPSSPSTLLSTSSHNPRRSSTKSISHPLRTYEEILDYLLTMREDQRKGVSERTRKLKAAYRETYGKLAESIPPDQVQAFTAFNDLEETILEMQNKALLVQGVLTAVASLVELDVDLAQAKLASQRYASVIRADTKEFGGATKDLLDALTRARSAIFHGGK